MISTLDWFWLYLQIFILMAIPMFELLKGKDRNLFAILIPVTMLVLVQGQAWWMFHQFDQRGVVSLMHLHQNISFLGAQLTNVYLGVWTLGFCGGYFFLNLRSVWHKKISFYCFLRIHQKLPVVVYFLVGIFILVTGGLFVHMAGGIQSVLTKPGFGVAGATCLAMSVGLGKLPLLQKMAWRQKLNIWDRGLFLLCLVFILFNSRFLTTFILLQVVILFNYRYHAILRRTWVWIAVGFLGIFILFGLYRDYGWSVEGKISKGGIQDYYNSYTVSNTPLDWFYGKNVEGFSGLAGLVTYEHDQGGIIYDWGLSSLRIFTQLLPNRIRNDLTLPFASWADYLESFYPFNGSVVPSGVQDAYAHAGIVGLMLFGLLLGWLTRWLHVHMLNPSSDCLMIGLLSVYSLHLIRGNFVTVMFFALFELMLLWSYRLIVSTASSLFMSSRITT
jgi:hypothetical protein